MTVNNMWLYFLRENQSTLYNNEVVHVSVPTYKKSLCHEEENECIDFEINFSLLLDYLLFFSTFGFILYKFTGFHHLKKINMF